MSKDFDLEPPKAPTAKKEKKGFLGNLFSSKKESTSPVIPKPDSSEIAALREKLGIGPQRGPTSQEHFDALEKGANMDADELSKKYDEEQLESSETSSLEQKRVEGSLDDALEEFSQSKGLQTPDQSQSPSADAPLFIDPSLVDQHNSAEEEETKKELEEGFDVTDFSEDIPEQEELQKTESAFAQDELQLEDSSAISSTSSTLAQEDTSVTSPVEKSLGEVESSSFIDEPASEYKSESESQPEFESESEPESKSQSFEAQETVPVAEDVSLDSSSSQERSFADELPEEIQKNAARKTSSFAEEDFASYDETPFAQAEFIDEGDESSSTLLTNVNSLQNRYAESTDFSQDNDALVAQLESSQKESPFAQDVDAADNEAVSEDIRDEIIEETADVIEDAAQQEKQEQQSVVTSSFVQEEPSVSSPQLKTKEELLAIENEQKILARAQEESEKEFQKYLNKEEKITASFLKREQSLQKYLDSERENFIQVVGLQSLTPHENDQVIAASEEFEKKLQQLYAKKYDSFSKWIQQESTLLKKNLADFKKKVALEKAQIKKLAKDVTKSQKEYRDLHKKTLAEQKKLLKLQEKQQDKIEVLIERETAVEQSEKELADKQKKYADIENKIEEVNKKLADIKSTISDHKKENKSLELDIKKQKEQSKEKQKHIKDLDKTILERQKELDNKDKLLATLHKKQTKFIADQKESNKLLTQREEAVLDKINTNEKILRTIELKQKALTDLENKIESEGFQSYIDAKLDQINPDEGILSDEEHFLDDSPELGLKIHKLMLECRQELATSNFAQAKKIYAEIRLEYVHLDIPHEEKSLLYSKIRELYDDINLKMLQERSEIRSVDVS